MVELSCIEVLLPEPHERMVADKTVIIIAIKIIDNNPGELILFFMVKYLMITILITTVATNSYPACQISITDL